MSHSKNKVGVFRTTGDLHHDPVIRPCSDLQRIMDAINSVPIHGRLNLIDAITYAIIHVDIEKIPIRRRRIVAFAGGPCKSDVLSQDQIWLCPDLMKDFNVALVLVNFGEQTPVKTQCLKWLVDNGNAHKLHVPPGSSVRDAVSQFIEESNLAPLGSLSRQEKKKDYGENLDPHKDMSKELKLQLEEFSRGKIKKKRLKLLHP